MSANPSYLRPFLAKGLLTGVLLSTLVWCNAYAFSPWKHPVPDEYSRAAQERAREQITNLKSILELSSEQEERIMDICLKTAERYIRIEEDYARDKGKYGKSVQHTNRVQIENIAEVLHGDQIKKFRKHKKILAPKSWKQVRR